MKRILIIQIWLLIATATVVAQQPAKVEACVSCHGLIEPMQKSGTTETLEKIKDGKDAVGLSRTGCHGANRVCR